MAKDNLSVLEDDVLRHVFGIYPNYGVTLGLHEYDGLLPPFSRDYVKGWIQKANELLKSLPSLDPSKPLSRRALDAELLRMMLEGALFDLTELRVVSEEPLAYVNPLNIQKYIIRDYAPAETRVRAITRHLKAIPEFLTTGQDNLSPVLPKPSIEFATDIAKGTPSNFEEAQNLLQGVSESLRAEFTEVKTAAVQAIDAFAKALQEKYLPRAKEAFALGEKKLSKLMWVLDRVQQPLDEILKMGLKDIEQNKLDFIETARRIDASKQAREIMSLVAMDHSKANSLIRDTQGLLEEIREFTVRKDLVTYPSEERCVVVETPNFARELFTAAMDSPGPFEEGANRAVYYVTPVDDRWSDERKEEWLRYLNTAFLKDISIHEAYPGHYLHFLHLKKLKTKASKAFISYAFTEGWAHYCEEMVMQQGFGAGDLKLRLAVLQGALTRDCRYICSIKMHTGQFNLKEATQFFIDNSFIDQLPAEREARRGAIDPGYYSYTLGKLFIKKTYQSYRRAHPESSLTSFHDLLLSWGAPPVGYLQKLIT
jgi:uncharacterized protein (DUF885 family)